MKKIFLTAASVLLLSGVFAQEKEIDNALSAYQANNLMGAQAELDKVANQIDSNTISPKSKATYYYVAGQLALVNGKSIEAAKHFNEMKKYETGTVYSIRNRDTKETEYFFTQQEAEAQSAKGNYTKVKSENLRPNYLDSIQAELLKRAEGTLTQASNAAQSGNDVTAGEKFLEASYLVEAIGSDGGLFKYNAALSYHKANKPREAFDIYKELIDENYTGESTTWNATVVETGQTATFNTRAEAKTQETLGIVTNIQEVKTPSIEKNLYTYALDALAALKEYDDVVEKISAKYPNDTEIQTLIANVYHFSGQQDMFLNKLKESARLDPKNPTNYFNIGVVYMEMDQDDQALEYFEKAIDADPNYKSAYTNIALIKVKADKDYIEKINSNLGSSAKEREVYKEYTEKRKNMYKEVIPYLEKAFNLEKTNLEYARMLRQAYAAAGMTADEERMIQIENSLQ